MNYVRVVERSLDKVTLQTYELEDETFDEYVEHEIEEYRDDPCGVKIVEFSHLDENKKVIKEIAIVL